MPNHIQNRLEFNGDEQDIQELLNHISSVDEDGVKVNIDFNKIKPMPKELDISADSWLSPLDNRFYYNDKFKERIDKFKNHLDLLTPMEREETEANFIQGIKNYLKLGYTNWYSWSIDEWGTKWNAYSQPDERNTSDTIYFQTAWSAPIELIKLLSLQFPNVEIIHTYSDEDSGSNTGIFKFKGGDVISSIQPQNQSFEAYTLYFELHPDDLINYKLVDGEYVYIDEDEENEDL